MESTKYVPPLVCWGAYLAAAASIMLTFYSPVIKLSPLWTGFYAYTAATVTIFVFSLASSNSSIYDPFWCYMPIILAIGWSLNTAQSGIPSARAICVLLVLIVWCARYAIQWPWPGWLTGLNHEDWRYVNVAKKIGGGTTAYWIFSLVRSVG